MLFIKKLEATKEAENEKDFTRNNSAHGWGFIKWM